MITYAVFQRHPFQRNANFADIVARVLTLQTSPGMLELRVLPAEVRLPAKLDEFPECLCEIRRPHIEVLDVGVLSVSGFVIVGNHHPIFKLRAGDPHLVCVDIFSGDKDKLSLASFKMKKETKQ